MPFKEIDTSKIIQEKGERDTVSKHNKETYHYILTHEESRQSCIFFT